MVKNSVIKKFAKSLILYYVPPGVYKFTFAVLKVDAPSSVAETKVFESSAAYDIRLHLRYRGFETSEGLRLRCSVSTLRALFRSIL